MSETIGLASEVGGGIIYFRFAQAGIETHRVERHLQVYGDVFQRQLVKGHFPVEGSGSGVRFGSSGVVHHYQHMGVAQFYAVEYGIFRLQVNTVAFEEEAPQHTFQLHTFYQIGGIHGNAVQGNFVHFHLSAYQGPCLHAHVQAFEQQQGVGSLPHGKGIAGGGSYLFVSLHRLNDLHTTHQQVQRETEVYPLYGYIHARSLGCDGSGLFPYQVLYRRHVKQYHHAYLLSDWRNSRKCRSR